MATVIRFSRHGTKKKPYFRMVVQNKTAPRDGKFIEHIGSFIPQKGGDTLKVERDRLEYWLSVGAQLSESVKNRLKAAKPAGTEAPKTEAPPAPPKKSNVPKAKKKEAAPKEA